MLLQMWTLKKLTLLYNKLKHFEIHQRPDDKLLGINQGCNTALINSQHFIIWSTMPTIYCPANHEDQLRGQKHRSSSGSENRTRLFTTRCLSEEDWGKMKLSELRRQNQKGRIPGSRQSTQKPCSNPLKA